MADPEGYGFPDDAGDDERSIISSRGLEAFGRKVTTTANHLIGPNAEDVSGHYKTAMAEVNKQMRRPNIQRSMFSMAKTTPTDMVRSKLSTSEIQHRALTHLSDELLSNIPEHENSYSLFQGFQASFPELTDDGKKHRRRVSRGRKLIDDGKASPSDPKRLGHLKRERASMIHELNLLGVRKSMSSAEIREIDNKIANLHGMRRIILERLAGFEQDEAVLEHDLIDVEGRVEEAQLLVDEAEEIAKNTATKEEEDLAGDGEIHEFMSQSVYEKIPESAQTTPSRKSKKVHRKKSMPILHEHFEPGSSIREIRAHKETITALDFDAPFGTLVTAALDDTVRVWDLNAGRCMGHLEGHTASVRTLQVEDNILATGSMDATIKLWDLSKTRYDPHGAQYGKGEDDEDAIAWETADDHLEPPEGSMDECELYTLEAHVDEITALHFRGDVLVSGSADKTIRHWDLEKGRAVQTLDVMWAAAQASATIGSGDNGWRPTGRASGRDADFVGALQVFESALACGTADGMVRLWDLRSGQVHRSLVGHTGAVTCLQFDDVHLITGSVDRSIRIWDLRTGSIYDAYAYDNPITDMEFDARRIVSAAGEDVVKVYDKVEGRQWDCGAGVTAADEVNMQDPKLAHLERYVDAASAVRNEASPSGTITLLRDEIAKPTQPYEQLLSRQAEILQEWHEKGARGINTKLLHKRLDDVASIAMSKFYSYRFFHLLQVDTRQEGSDVWDVVVEKLDRALITTGGQSNCIPRSWFDGTMESLSSLLSKPSEEPQLKRRKIQASQFSKEEPHGRPVLIAERTISRHADWTLEDFEDFINSTKEPPNPIIFSDLIDSWPALTDRPWASVDHLLDAALGGRRLVPIEVGRSYVDEGWGQELINFKTFLSKYILTSKGQVGYLAQHDLFTQIPSLRNDVQIPDFCWADVPGHPTDASKNQEKLDIPSMNAWFGPAKTITPLHTDGYHNLLCQVVGTKYVRLYPPSSTEKMRPRKAEEGVDMSNTSEVDVGILEGWDPYDGSPDELGLLKEELSGVDYWEGILGPGDTLLIPMGWWHYVRSLSISFSVSFWWN
ncbi:Mitochondrial division protein-like protein [Emericellopsis cladophorae]|uniref:Mitochondrial division protein 1 n=1 Tax=Emericellopsis cladophorae TaxID=2686198 RepID=A0A9P9Y2T2_9HYPO|nr:Mitochondrial division protein-like protein [Emericellopsis cladophorae]KAI6782108.1 Mitochondrial division protein-like protein [Emericellopsis cladophorae]